MYMTNRTYPDLAGFQVLGAGSGFSIMGAIIPVFANFPKKTLAYFFSERRARVSTCRRLKSSDGLSMQSCGIRMAVSRVS